MFSLIKVWILVLRTKMSLFPQLVRKQSNEAFECGLELRIKKIWAVAKIVKN